MCCSFFSYLCFLAQTLSFIHISLDFVFLVSALDKNIKFMGLLKNSHNSNKLYPPLFSPSQLISPRRCSSIRPTLRAVMDSILILPNFPQCVILSVSSLGFVMLYPFKTEAIYTGLLTIAVTLKVYQVILEFLDQCPQFSLLSRSKSSILTCLTQLFRVCVSRCAHFVWLYLSNCADQGQQFIGSFSWCSILTCPLRSRLSSSIRCYLILVTPCE